VIGEWSSDPHNKEKQQEPRLLSVMSGDESMKESYRQGKDLYATMGVGVYKNNYWDNMEHHEDGSPNPDGKKRRSNMKVLLLGRHICPSKIM
jgi:hypothetical protein